MPYILSIFELDLERVERLTPKSSVRHVEAKVTSGGRTTHQEATVHAHAPNAAIETERRRSRSGSLTSGR